MPLVDIDDKLRELATNIRLVVFDVDGVLTDGRFLLGADGYEYKAFNSRDGHGIKMLRRSGVEVSVISGRKSESVTQRMVELGVKHEFQGCSDKLQVLDQLLQTLGLATSQTAFVGDDVLDLPIMLRVGLAVAVNDAHETVRDYAHWITPHDGGKGAVRDVCDMIMHVQGTYAAELHRYL